MQRPISFRTHPLISPRGWCFILSLITALILCTDRIYGQQSAAVDGTGRIDASHLFPHDTVVYLQVNDIGALVESALNHPLREKIESLEQVRKGLSSPQFLQLRLGVALLETQLDTDWLTALKALGGQGLYLGAELSSQSIGVAIHANDEELLKRAVTSVLGLIRSQSGSGPPPFIVADYANGKTAKFEENLSIGRFGAWLLLSNKHEFLLKMADRLLLSNEDATLADSKELAAAKISLTEEANVWLYTALQPIRDSGQAQALFRGMTDEPPVELLFGGVLEALKYAPWFTADLAFHGEQIVLNSHLPFDAAQTSIDRGFFFGTQGLGRAPMCLDIPETMMQATIYRDLSSWWLSKENLFPENVVAQLAQGDSQLSTVFGGVDFGADVLGSLQPGMRFIVKQQEYAADIDPETKLPSFALIVRLQNPEQARRFRISFQSLVGLLNLAEGGMYRPQIEVMSTREDGIQLTTGTYVPEAGYDGGLIIFNFSPTLAFQDDYMIISSTEQLAREIALKTKELDIEADSSESNTTISVNVPEVVRLLRLNHAALVANQMLEQGVDRKSAESQVNLILEVLEFARAVNLDFRVDSKSLLLKIELLLLDNRN
ncbi:MAG TPA: hypothetical protein PKD64_03860 [Pirellulaceae bacterium]|nr:hypothetical protein [Pirellulaceae bacterium]HMO91307.1 hypothetical protein [Pirellulaceae bacterium]HMP68509.1 hypothetical protein [Pirellulaceae bacterium]